MSTPPNIALVVLDTMRKDYFDKHFDWIPGLHYDRAFSTSHSTSPVHASLFTGKYPSEVGVYKTTDELNTQQPVLAEQLSEAGYTTKAFSSNPLVSPPFKFDRGFDDFQPSWKIQSAVNDLFDWVQFSNNHDGFSRYPRGIIACIRSEKPTLPSLRQAMRTKMGDIGVSKYQDDGVREFRSWLENQSGGSSPEFLFANLMEAHSPYRPPPEYRSIDDSEYYYPNAIEVSFTDESENVDQEIVKKAYEDSVSYLSSQYEMLFDDLQDQYDIIITCGDHGELFGEPDADNLWGHFHGVYKQLTNIPLVVSGESILTDRVGEAVSLKSVYNTILASARVDNGGTDLRNGETNETVLTQTHGITGHQLESIPENKQSIVETILNSYNKRYDGVAVDTYYGHESVGGWRESGERLNAPKELLNELRGELNEEVETAYSGNISDSLSNQLEMLGYK